MQKQEPKEGIKFIAIIELIIEAIHNNDPKSFNWLMQYLPIERVDVKVSDNLLRMFLSYSMKFRSKDVAKSIFKEWNRVYPKMQKPELIIVMFTMSFFQDELINWIITEVKRDLTYREVILELTNYDVSDETKYGCFRADKIYGPQTFYMYRELMNSSAKNPVIEDYLIEKIKEVSPFASIPKHVIISNNPPHVQELSIKINYPKTIPLHVEEALELVLGGIYQVESSEVRIQESIENFINKYNSMNDEEKIEFLDPYIKRRYRRSLKKDKNIFHLLGPSNAILDVDNEYGGERMLTSRYRDYIEEEGRYFDWFTGSCDECYKKIKYRWYAVRKPVIIGGWFGCFCSWDCCRKQAIRGPDSVIDIMTIGVAESRTNAVGIIDRIPNPNRPNDVIDGSFLPLIPNIKQDF